MKKLLILALASAVAAASNAAGDWFKVDVSGSTQTPTGAKWSTTPAAADVANDVISIDADVDTALELTPDEGNTAPDPQTNTVVTVEAMFTASSDVPENLTGAMTALTVAKVNDLDYYYYWDSSANDPAWTQISREIAEPTLNTPVTVRIELDNTSMAGTTATIKVDGTTVATVANASTKTKVSGLAFAGTGKIGNINADYTKAYASYNNTYYATVGGAIAAKGGNLGDITVYAHNNVYPANIIKGANDVLLFPRTTTADQDGTAEHPYEIADADDLIALKDAVANVDAARSKSYEQTANIDMASAGAFAGIGADSKQFSGVYDGNDKTISNVTFTPRTYSGVFNSVNNATIKNLTVDTVGFANDADGEYGGAAIVGKISGTSTLTNLVAKGSVGSGEKPFTHNAAGVAVRVTGGNVTIVDCHNEAAVYGAYSKLAGIINLVQADSGSVVITNCSNSGAITALGTFVNDNKTRNAGDNGVAGILSYANMPTTITACSNSGELREPSGAGGAKIGQIVGWVQGKTLTDGGSNCASSSQGMIGHKAGGTVNGFQYATVDNNNVATTIAPPYTLTKDTTYLLEGDVGAGTVFTLAAAGDTIAFDTALGYNFGGTVAAAQGLKLKDPATSGTVTTYEARALATPTVTVTGGENATAAWTVNGVAVATAPATLTEGDTYSVTYTANKGYEFADGATKSASGTAGTENIVITISDAVEVTQIEIDSTAETTLVAVPADCKADGLIDLSNRVPNDELKVYSKADDVYYTWKLSSGKEWALVNTYKVSESTATQHSKAASEVQLYAGQAAWLTRVNPNEAIKLAVVAESDTINVTVDNGWNMIAPLPKGNDSTVALNAVVSAGAAGDEIKIPTAGAPITCTYDSKTEKWGYWSFIKNDKGRIIDKEWVSDVTIPAGTGLWYINGGSSKSVELK